MPREETLLLAGLGAFGALILGGLAVLVFGRLSGGLVRGKRHSEGPPSEGSVSPERHQNTGAVSSR